MTTKDRNVIDETIKIEQIRVIVFTEQALDCAHSGNYEGYMLWTELARNKTKEIQRLIDIKYQI